MTAPAPIFYRSSDVATRFRVTRRTVTRWATEGRLPYVRTPGGHRRYSIEAVDLILGQHSQPGNDSTPVTAVMPPHHYSPPAELVASHDIRFRIRMAFTGGHPRNYAWLGAHCLTCHTSRDIGTDRSLGDLIRWYAQHAGRPAAEHAVLTALAAISPTGSDK